MKLIDNPEGNYRFLTGIAPYSAGVVSIPDYEIVHASLLQPVPYRDGFELIEQHLRQHDRNRSALCAIELRSPTPFSFTGFSEFNRSYQALLSEWGLMIGDMNPIARTNIAPQINPPSEPSLYGFAYTVPSPGVQTVSFIVAGAGDLCDQADLREENIVRPGETSVDAMNEKATIVMDVMQERLFGLGRKWPDVTTVDVYTVQPVRPMLESGIFSKAEATSKHGIRWHYSHPPIEGLAFEMDLRAVIHEQWLYCG